MLSGSNRRSSDCATAVAAAPVGPFALTQPHLPGSRHASHVLSFVFTNPHRVLSDPVAECSRAVLPGGHGAQSLTLNQIRETVHRGGACRL